jgi:hypothetical protein
VELRYMSPCVVASAFCVTIPYKAMFSSPHRKIN